MNQYDKRKKLLIIMGLYIPNYSSGGPITSVRNLTDALGDRFDFYIMASDRDNKDDEQPYPDIVNNEWNQVGKAKVYYTERGKYPIKLLKKLIDGMDCVYLCGFYGTYVYKTLILKRLKLINARVIIAAQGTFSKGALSIKSRKKNIYIEMINRLHLLEGVDWAATSDSEIQDIKTHNKNRNNTFYIATNIPRKFEFKIINKNKITGNIRLVWISRITPVKNLIGTIETISSVNGNIELDIYGYVDDQNYYNECVSKLNDLPQNVKWNIYPAVESEKVIDTFRNYHVFIFETLGENFGHVIFEALAGGCPCIISDATPWKDFGEREVGYSFPLSDRENFSDSLQKYIDMDFDEYNKISEKCVEYALSNPLIKNSVQSQIKLFEGTEV
jgi:glycosyltransferase involved in cell wall biosynthesis